MAACLAVGAGLYGPACTDPATGPVPVCGEEPTLVLERTVEGRLSDGDDRLANAYIDYYSLELPDRQRVTITLTSSELIPLLILVDVDGTVIEQAFPRYAAPSGTPESASLSWGFDAGCHLIGASSFTSGATGAYELRAVEQPPLE